MITKIPRWVWTGAWVLAFSAGVINVVGVLGFSQGALSHMTGAATMLSSSIVSRNLQEFIHFAFVIASFVAGTIASGIIIGDTALNLGRRYGIALLIESALLFAAIPFLNRSQHMGTYFALAACGLQNALVSTYSGALIRTTHLTGMFTDLGIYLGHFLRGLNVDVRRLKLCGLVISGFVCGGVTGAFLFTQLAHKALYLPGALTMLMAFSYSIFNFFLKRHRKLTS